MPPLYFVLTAAAHLLGGVIDQPHPQYQEGTWLTHRLEQSIDWASCIAVAIMVLVPLDLMGQYAQKCDTRMNVTYYPNPLNLSRWWSTKSARITLVAGVLLLAGYYASTVIAMTGARMGSDGIIWPPERVFLCIMWGWGIIWLADCFTRPGYATMVAAVGYLCFMLLIAPSGLGILRE